MEARRLHVLVIEHDEAFARAVSGMLEGAHDTIGRVVVAVSLEEAVARLVEAKFDVIILEFFLPDGAGLLNIPVLREHAPRVPVIVFGAADDEAFALEAVHAGAQDYLVKGQLSPRWLLRSVRYAMERHDADLALLAAEEQYRGIFDHLVEGIFQTTPDGQYLMANAALARIYGYGSPAELTRSLTDIGERLYVQPGRRDEFVRTMQEGDTITGFESQIYRKDGSIIWISENCRAIRDSKGRLLYYEGTVEDISQQREAELKLRDSEALYHSLVETLPQNIFRKDLQERFTFANQQFCKTLGHTLADIIGKTDFDFFPPDMAAKFQRDDTRVMATSQSYETVEEHQLPDGSKIYVQVVKTPLRGAYGQITGLQGIFWDITPQKLAEEQIRKANEELARSREELRVKNEVMEGNLKMAREIQLAMLPQQYPVLPPGAAPADSAFQFTHRYQPSGTVGGDFFSISALSDTEVAVFICDVAGHGVRSALVTAMARALVEELRPFAHDPGQFMTKLNSDLFAILKHSGTPVLTTAFYLVADSATGAMRYANAGHPKPLQIHRRAEKVEALSNVGKKSQPALGLFERANYQTSQSTLAPGDLVMLFTDGLYEVSGADGDIYTQAMLTAAMRKRLLLPSAKLFDELLAEVRAYSADGEFDDDICIVGVDYAGNAAAKPG
jgi:sigma-B regulation protein RsbU (phosphoserine phosphatase)